MTPLIDDDAILQTNEQMKRQNPHQVAHFDRELHSSMILLYKMLKINSIALYPTPAVYVPLAVQQTDAVLGHAQLLSDRLLQLVHALARVHRHREAATGRRADV